jgi:hypothetical protein
MSIKAKDTTKPTFFKSRRCIHYRTIRKGRRRIAPLRLPPIKHSQIPKALWKSPSDDASSPRYVSVGLHPINPHRNAIDERERLRVFCEHCSERACDDVSGTRPCETPLIREESSSTSRELSAARGDQSFKLFTAILPSFTATSRAFNFRSAIMPGSNR